jgi:UDP-N-acetyl-D-glucosamine 4,6-dehydratase
MEGSFSLRVILINFAFYLLSIILLRFLKRIYLEMFIQKTYNAPMILIGASNTAQALIKDYSKKYHIQAIIDDEVSLKDTYISNVKIYSLDDLDKLISSNCKIIITKEMSFSKINDIFDIAHKKNIKDIKIVKESDNQTYDIKDVSIEDLLPRSPKDFDKVQTKKFIENKTILITGAGGSIGSEIVNQCILFGAKEILLLDHSEFNLYTIGEDIKNSGFSDYKLFLKSVVNKTSIEEVFTNHNIDICIHAAAYKHVSLVQSNIKDAIVNNIIGTKNCIDLSIKYNLESFVLISTDKAIRPTSIMGATKRICELYAQNIDSKNTTVSAVRFGNVLNSSGSVIPKFKSLIKQNKDLTVTHRDVTRYFMLISEACELTLQASSLAKGSQVFILDMGEPIKIVDLAKNMLKLYNKENLKIKFIGLQKGEKLYEELLIDDASKQTQYQSIIIAKDTPMDINILDKYIKELVDTDDYFDCIKKIIPEFNPS